MAEPFDKISGQAVRAIARQAFKGGLTGYESRDWWDKPIHCVGPESVSPLVAGIIHATEHDRCDTPRARAGTRKPAS